MTEDQLSGGTVTVEREAKERSPGQDDFAELSRAVRDAGLLAPRKGYYVVRISVIVLALGGLLAGVVVIGDSWWSTLLAAGLGFVFTQVGFIGHDAGHRQIAASRRVNNVVGLLSGNLVTGFSFGWWLTKHNRHHAHTNRPDKDPDVGAGALVYTPEQTESRRGLPRVFARAQAFLLIPLLFLEALNLHLVSILALARRRDRAALVESGLLASHLAIFFVGPFFVLSPLRAVVFVAVLQCLFGFYLGSAFVTNHIGMPILAETNKLGFLRRQVLTSRNLSGRWFTTFWFGGLDMQIEHHLFPTMPRVNLRRARKIVRPYCAERLIGYSEESPWVAYRNVLRYLHTAGAALPVPVIG